VKIRSLNNGKKSQKAKNGLQYSPEIMHTQEVAQELLAPQEHASCRKK